jgi:hypothetical protein
MASNINITNIDTTYPIAGQDNDSQGFRDNFTNINTNFTEAKSEIEALQVDFLNTVIDHGGVADPTTIGVSVAPYQKITPTEPINIAFTNFTAGSTHSAVQLEVNINSVAYTITLPAEVTIGLDAMPGIVGSVITFPDTGTYILEFASADAGTTISVHDLTPTPDGGVTQLSELTDVNTSTTTNRFVLVADGVDFESRLLVEADITDLGAYITTAGVTYEQLDTNGDVGTTAGTLAIGNHTHPAATEPTTSYGTTGAIALDTAAGTYFYPSGTTTGIITFTFTNPAASGTVTAFTMELLGAGNNAPVWPASVDWPAGTEPTWTAGTDVVSFITRDNGTTWLGMLGGLAFA